MHYTHQIVVIRIVDVVHRGKSWKYASMGWKQENVTDWLEMDKRMGRSADYIGLESVAAILKPPDAQIAFPLSDLDFNRYA